MITITILAVVLVYLFLTGCTYTYMEDMGYWYIAIVFGSLLFPVSAPLLLLFNHANGAGSGAHLT